MFTVTGDLVDLCVEVPCVEDLCVCRESLRGEIWGEVGHIGGVKGGHHIVRDLEVEAKCPRFGTSVDRKEWGEMERLDNAVGVIEFTKKKLRPL